VPPSGSTVHSLGSRMNMKQWCGGTCYGDTDLLRVLLDLSQITNGLFRQ
jgi:hypothetical protein